MEYLVFMPILLMASVLIYNGVLGMVYDEFNSFMSIIFRKLKKEI